MKEQINMLFVCGYGVGSSAISETIVKKALKEAGINVDMKHTAMGEMFQYKDWVDVIAISKKLAEGVTASDYPNAHIIEVINVMDGKGIAKQVGEVVDEFYPNARKTI